MYLTCIQLKKRKTFNVLEYLKSDFYFVKLFKRREYYFNKFYLHLHMK